jgi:hypothetical protein
LWLERAWDETPLELRSAALPYMLTWAVFVHLGRTSSLCDRNDTCCLIGAHTLYRTCVCSIPGSVAPVVGVCRFGQCADSALPVAKFWWREDPVVDDKGRQLHAIRIASIYLAPWFHKRSQLVLPTVASARLSTSAYTMFVVTSLTH